MTTEERFARIETELAATTVAIRALVDMQTGTQRMLTDLTEQISRYIDTADARMRRIEENLDGLIRAITAEHSN